ncbi:HD domain-containing protein [Psychrobacter sp. 1U1]|uniref:HD domain-containing protein n=1 Tax=Psychrobacter sp. 1U1 TaxID=3453576 RepID=UPI003F470297
MDDLSQTEAALGLGFARHLSAIDSDIKSAEVNALWQDIATRYNEATRAYHTLRHLQQLFAQFEQVKHKLYEPHIIALALYYHDVIYNPTSTNNEQKSAEHAVEALSHYLSVEQCQYISALIMMTANHQLDELANPNKISDASYLLDMDLSVLGASWPEYKQYTKAVRQEYSHVPLTDYCTGRMAVLNGLLAHPKLYLTNYYYERLEMQARDNIKRELTLLAA